MVTDIYDLHTKAFQGVSAYAILRAGERVATVAFKHPKDGAGRLWAYVHWIGMEMVRGSASGGGYDKSSAAVGDAAKKLEVPLAMATMSPEYGAFWRTALGSDCSTWDRDLERAGFTVCRAI